MARYKKSRKGNDEIKEQKRLMQEAVEKEQDIIWHEEETLRKYLLFAASFHRYSYNNQLLIYAKFPNATMVQTYGGWIKKGRKVKPPENKNYIELFAPQPKQAWVTKEVVKEDGNIELDENGNKKTKKECVNYMDYRVVYVYEVSQTEGERLPELSGEAEDPLYETREDLFHALSPLCGQLSESMPACDMLRCVSQEFLIQQYDICVPHEVEACAFVLSAYLQLGSQDCNTSTVFDWAKSRDRKEIASSMDHVLKACKKIINALEGSVCLQ